MLISAIGLWNWQRWGYRGLLGLFGASVALNLCGGDIIQAILAGVYLFILIKLVEEKSTELE